jgi:hypothetical protein
MNDDDNKFRLTLAQFCARKGAKNWHDTKILRLASRNAVPALCSKGCNVEQDGTCEHGNQSLTLALGLI